VLVEAEAATINPADLAIVSGAAAGRFPSGTIPPYIPGWDVVGQVEGCGEGVDRALLGARVVGLTVWFSTGRAMHASLVTVPVGDVVVVPAGLPSPELATVGLNGLTAWRGLADLDIADGETLVVTGAAGGVGGFAVELAAARGVAVIGVVRATPFLRLGKGMVSGAGGRSSMEVAAAATWCAGAGGPAPIGPRSDLPEGRVPRLPVSGPLSSARVR